MYIQLRVFLIVFFSLVISACGGGGGGGSAPQDNFSVSSTQVDFAADIDASAPASQTITGTINNINTAVRVDIVINGTTINAADFAFVGSNGGQLTISVKQPDELGVGLHTDEIRVYACTDFFDCSTSTNQISGSPKTINVSYSVTAIPTVRYVAPRVAQPNTSDEVIIRGIGFSLLTSPSVSFGSDNALSMTVVNDTEIRATFPALVTGDYAVNVSDMSGAIATQATLHVMAEPALGYAFIANSGSKTRVLYDAVRDAIYFGNKDTDEVIRYSHSVDPGTGEPVWTSTTLAVTGADDIAFMPDGKTLLALSGSNVIHIDLDTFSPVASTFVPNVGSISFLRQLGIANNGIGFLAPGINGSGASFIYKYNARKRTVTMLSEIVSQGTVGVSGDGSKVFIGSRDSNTSFNVVHQYDATSDAPLGQLGMSETTNALPVDRTGNTLVLGYQNFLNDQRKVYKSSVLQGGIPGSGTMNINYATALSSDGNTLYSYNPQADVINIYDITSPDGANSFNQTPNSPLPVADSVGNILALTMGFTPFEQTLFIAGDAGVVVQPLP